MKQFTVHSILLIAICFLPSVVWAQGVTTYPTTIDDGVSLLIPVDDKVATLTVALTSSATTATVNSTTGFLNQGVLLIDREQIAYTAKTGTTFTGLIRGFAGTTARPHSINFVVKSAILAVHITGARGAVIELEKKLGTGASEASAATTGWVLTKNADGTTGWKVSSGGGGGGAVDSVFGRVGDVIAAADDYTGAQITQDATHRFATDTEKTAWNAKQDALGFTAVPNTRTVNGHPLSTDVVVTPTDLALVIGTNVQAYDPDLVAFAGLSPANDDIVQRKAGSWINRTMAQLKVDLVVNLVDNTSDVTKNAATVTLTNKTISGASNTLTNLPAANISGVIPIANLATGIPTGSKFIRDDGTLQVIPGGGDALTTNPLSQFAITTAAQFFGLFAAGEKTGTGKVVANDSPELVGTPSLPIGTIGATQSAGDSSTKLATTAFATIADNLKENLANKNASGGYVGLTLLKIDFRNVAGTFTSFFTNSNTAPQTYTFQNRTGTIADDTDVIGAKARGNHTGTQLASTVSDFNTAALVAAPAETTTTVGTLLNSATSKTTPVDADYLGLMDSAASNIWKKLSWANTKAGLKAYFDTLYPTGSGSGGAVTYTIANGTSALGTGAIASGACATVVTTSATGTATTDTIMWGFNGTPIAVTGYIPSTNGMLTIIGYPTANNVNWSVCNNTTASITPGAVTLNWRVVR